MRPAARAAVREARNAWLSAREQRSALEEQVERAEALVEEQCGGEWEWDARRRSAALVGRVKAAGAREWEAKQALVAALQALDGDGSVALFEASTTTT